MEVISGYKQTEMGVIPKDWDVKSFGEIAFLRKERIDPKRTGVKEFCIELEHIEQGTGRLIGFTNTSESTSLKSVFKKGDVLFGKLRAYLRKYWLAKSDGVCSTEIWVLVANHNLLIPELLFQFVKVDRFIETASLAYGTHMPRSDWNVVKNYPVRLPTLSEQEAIAEALNDADAHIEALEKLLAKKRQVKQGAMQELLTGKRRLPGFEKKTGYKQTEIGTIPEDWVVKRLGELFEITSSRRVFQSQWKTEGIPFYRARELAVLGEQGFVNNELFITREMYNAFKKTYGVPKVGDILVTGVGTLGKVYVVPDEREFYFKDGNIIWFKICGKVNSEFLHQLYSTPLIIKQIEDNSAGTTVGTYTISGAHKTVIPYPALPEQTAIAEILSDMDAEIAALEAKLAKARQVKQGMMSVLLTGRVRLV